MQQKMDQPIYTHHRPHGRRSRFIKSSYNNKPPCLLLLPTADENQKPKWTSRGTKKLYITGVWNQKGVQNSQRVNSAKMDKPPVNFRQFIIHLSFQLLKKEFSRLWKNTWNSKGERSVRFVFCVVKIFSRVRVKSQWKKKLVDCICLYLWWRNICLVSIT